MPQKYNFPDPLESDEVKNNSLYSARIEDIDAYFHLLFRYLTEEQYRIYLRLESTFKKYCKKQRMDSIEISFREGSYQVAPFDPELAEFLSQLNRYFLDELKNDALDYYREIRYQALKLLEWEQGYLEFYIKKSLCK